MEFWGYYRALRRWRGVIAAALFAAVAIAFVVNRPTTGDFAATATLSIPSVQHFFGTSTTAAATLPTQEDLNARTAVALNRIRSRDVAEQVIRQLHLPVRPDELIKRITTVRDPVGNLIKVTVTAATAQDAITLANAVAETAAAYDRDVQRRESTMAREFVEKQAAGIRADLQAAENALLVFQQRNGKELATPRSAQAAGLQNELDRTNFSLEEIQVKLGVVSGQMSTQDSVRTDRRITDNPIAQQLRSDLVQLEVVLTSELAIHTDKYPGVVALKAKIEAIKDRLKTELSRVVSQEQVRFNPVYDAVNQARINLETEKMALLARKEALQRALGQADRDLPEFARKQLEQGRLTRNVDLLNKQFAEVQQQLGQARIREQESQNLGSLAVLDHARTAPLSPFGGLRFKLTLASALGLVGGVALAFFLEYLDNTVKTPEQAERAFGIPALTTIPHHNPPFAEAYRLLRVNLAPYAGPEGADAVVVTSSRPGSGTSTVVANLARAFAWAGRRTIVVDADVRRPTQHAQFGVPNRHGLIEVLTGAVSLQDALLPLGVPNLWLLPCGSSAIPDAPSLLGSEAMARLLADLKRTGDVVLVDTPPAGAFSDALTVAPLASGVLLVVEAGRATRPVDRQVKVQLERLGAKVLGLVLTKVRPDLVDSYYYQRFYKPVSRRRLSPAATAAGVLILMAGMGVLAGFAAKAGSQAVDRWLFSAPQHSVVERAVSVFSN